MRLFVAFVAVLLLAEKASGGAPGCPGDCDADGRVAINELVLAVGIALGRSPLDSCPAADSVVDGIVRINELIAAVRNALDGCPAAETPTPTATPTNTPLDVWEPASVPFDPECAADCQEDRIGTDVAHGGGDVTLAWNPAVDDATAQWGDCLESMLACFRLGDGVRACAAAGGCPDACKTLFSERAPPGDDADALLRALESVYVDPGAPCRPAMRSAP